MITITNKLFQPLSYQLADGTGLHLAPRGQTTIPDRQLSADLRQAAQRGVIALLTPASGETTATVKTRKPKED